MTPKTLTKERRQRFEAIIRAWIDDNPVMVWRDGSYDIPDEQIEKLAALLADAAASRTEVRGIEAQADRKVDAILELEKQAQAKEAAGQAWRGREILMPDLLPYGDWWHKKTGLHMYGAKAKAKVSADWLKAFKEWHENELTIKSLEAAFEANKWRGVISTPLVLTKDAIAIQAAPVVETKKADLPTYQPEDESQFVPAPEKK